MTRVLFVCSMNRLRSPTAEHVFADWPGIEVASAGTRHDADQPLSPELVAWAELIFVMEQTHRRLLSRRYRPWLRAKRVVCLEIPDVYDFMDSRLVTLLRAKVPAHLPSG